MYCIYSIPNDNENNENNEKNEHLPSLNISGDEYETLLSFIPPETPSEYENYKDIYIPLDTHQDIIQAFSKKHKTNIRHFLDNIKRLKRTKFISTWESS